RQTGLQAVVAKGALPRDTLLVHRDDAERAPRNAVAAAVADVLLDIDRVVLGPSDRACWAHLEAARLDAVLADVRHHQPAPADAVWIGNVELLDELDVTKRRSRELHRVVVGVARE